MFFFHSANSSSAATVCQALSHTRAPQQCPFLLHHAEGAVAECGPAGQALGVRDLPPVFLPPETLLPGSRDSGGAYLRAVVLRTDCTYLRKACIIAGRLEWGALGPLPPPNMGLCGRARWRWDPLHSVACGGQCLRGHGPGGLARLSEKGLETLETKVTQAVSRSSVISLLVSAL